MNNYICSECGKVYDPKSLLFRCPECMGVFDLEDSVFKYYPEKVVTNEWNIFRYQHALPVGDSSIWKGVTLGEGFTGIVPLDADNSKVMVKMDYMMPTLSFKDRGAALLVSIAKEIGVEKIVQDSSGNAGNSVAAYAGRAGIPCEIFVPEGTSYQKIEMIKAHGADVVEVPGTREDTAKAALMAAEKKDVFYASHVYNPYFYQGTKTYVYEIYEQLSGNLPDNFMIPVGNGTLLLGCYYAFRDLMHSGLIQRMPKIIAVQSSRCNPIYRAFMADESFVSDIKGTPTLAEGIAIAKPMRGKHILEAIRDTKGTIVLSPEEKITPVKNELAKKGFYVEPTTAATFAAYYEIAHKIEGSIILPLCGAGLKSSK